MIVKEEKRRRARVKRINTVGGVSAEMAVIYRKARWGEIKPDDAKTFVTILAIIRDGLVSAGIEKRMGLLESSLNDDDFLPRQPLKLVAAN
jgi:hypothetical protein